MNKVIVIIGDPIHFDDLLHVEGDEVFRRKLYDAVSSRIGHRLHELKVQVDRLALQQATELQSHPISGSDRAARIWQQVDWELLGMENFTSGEDDALLKNGINFGPQLDVTDQHEAASSNRYFRVGLSYEGEIATRMRNFMDHTEFMVFAARGLFMNRRAREVSPGPKEVGPLKAWKQYLEANVPQQWNYC